MFYDFAVTVPAGTPESAPVEQEINLTSGQIQKVHILFPPGPHGLVKVRIFDGGHQYLPTNPDGYFWSDDEVVKAEDEAYDLSGAESMKILAYSPGTSYDHTIGVRVSISRPDELTAKNPLVAGLQSLLKLIGVGG